jgi:hypothetical protein
LRKINLSSFRRPLPPMRRLSSGKSWILLSRMELSVTFQEAKETRRKFRILILYQLKTTCTKSDNSFKTLPLLMPYQQLKLERKYFNGWSNWLMISETWSRKLMLWWKQLS